MLRHLLAIHLKLSAEPPQPLTATEQYIAENLDEKEKEEGDIDLLLDPATGAPLGGGEDGEEKAVLGLADLPAFLERVADAWLGAGIAKQLAAFAQGMEETTPLDKLRMFTAEEAVHLFSGVPVGPFCSPLLARRLRTPSRVWDGAWPRLGRQVRECRLTRPRLGAAEWTMQQLDACFGLNTRGSPADEQQLVWLKELAFEFDARQRAQARHSRRAFIQLLVPAATRSALPASSDALALPRGPPRGLRCRATAVEIAIALGAPRAVVISTRLLFVLGVCCSCCALSPPCRACRRVACVPCPYRPRRHVKITSSRSFCPSGASTICRNLPHASKPCRCRATPARGC